MIVLQDIATGCVNLAKALTQLGLNQKVLTNPLCLDPRVAQGLGGDYPKWTWAIASSLGFDATDKGVPPFLKVFKKYGQAKITPDPWVPVGFGQALTVVKWLNTIGPTKITPAAIVKQGKLERGPVPLGPRRSGAGSTPSFRRSATTRHSSSSTWVEAGSSGSRAGSGPRRSLKATEIIDV